MKLAKNTTEDDNHRTSALDVILTGLLNGMAQGSCVKVKGKREDEYPLFPKNRRLIPSHPFYRPHMEEIKGVPHRLQNKTDRCLLPGHRTYRR